MSEKGKQTQIQIPMRKTNILEDQFEGAVIVNGEFHRALTDTNLERMVEKGMSPFMVLGPNFKVGTRVLVTMTIDEVEE